MIPKTLRNQKEPEQSPQSSPEAVQQSFIPTLAKPSVHLHTTHSSPSASSTSQNLLSTPNTQTAIVVPVVPPVPFLPVVPLIPVNMANRYAPLQLPANPGTMPQDYQTKITYFDATGSGTALQHTKKMQDFF